MQVALDQDVTCIASASGHDSALTAARKIPVPEVVLRPRATRGGATEAQAWWDAHEDLFARAWAEYGVLHPECYTFNYEYVDPSLIEAIRARSFQSILTEVAPGQHGLNGAYRFKLFTPEFCMMLMEEVDHINNSQIPMRRPNGMNRFGNILDDFGFKCLFRSLATEIVEPLALEMWPQWVGKGECCEQYGFVVRYKIGEDLNLAEHTDTSNVTLNLCMGKEFEGGELYFKGVRYTESAKSQEKFDVSHVPGEAVIHLGGHYHAAQSIRAGDRQNLILWCWGEGGWVRIAPIDPAKNKPIWNAFS